MEADKLVTLCEFDKPEEAHIARVKLESAGIECFVQDELGNILYSNATCGVELQVKSSDMERARALLDEQEEIQTEE